MSILTTIRRGRVDLPPRVVVYGTEGIGKSTFAAAAPSPIFVPTEDGLANIDCASFPQARTLADVTAALTALAVERHEFQTVVVDSLDWLERLVWDAVCAKFRVANIEQADGGFARGYGHALDPWRALLAQLDTLRDHGMIVIGIAHAQTQRVEDPELPAYDRHAPRLHKRSLAVVCEWADAVMFAGRKTRVQREDAGFNRQRGIVAAVGAEGGERTLRCIGGPGCLAKNRYGLPEEIPLSWPALMAAMTAQHKETTSG